MPTYGYIRTSRDQEPGHPGSDPHVQRRQLVEAGVDPARIYADVAASGAKDYNSRDQWHVLDQQLAQGDVLVVAAIDRLGRRYLENMWAIYDLQRRGIRLRSLADSEVQWTKYLDADPDSPEAFMGNVLASMAAYVASQERQNISRRTRRGFKPPGRRGWNWAGRVVSPTSRSLPSGRTWREGCRWRRWHGSTGCPGQRSAAPWAGRNEVGQGDAIFKNTWTLSELGVVRMGLIADEQSAMAHVLKTAG